MLQGLVSQIGKAGTIGQFAVSIHNCPTFFSQGWFINLGQGCAVVKYNVHIILLRVTSMAHHVSLPSVTFAVINTAALSSLLGWKQSPHPAPKIRPHCDD